MCVSEHELGPPRESNPPPLHPSDSPPTLQLTRRHSWWWTLLFCFFSAGSSFLASWRHRGAVDGAVPQTPRRCCGAPRKGYENSCRRMKNSCGVTVYLSIPDSSSPPLCPLSLSFCADDMPVGAAHGCFGVGWWEVGGGQGLLRIPTCQLYCLRCSKQCILCVMCLFVSLSKTKAKKTYHKLFHRFQIFALN